MLPPNYRTASPDGNVVTVYCGDQKVHEERAENQTLAACIAAQERAEAWAQEHAAKAEAAGAPTRAPTPAPAAAPRAREPEKKKGSR